MVVNFLLLKYNNIINLGVEDIYMTFRVLIKQIHSFSRKIRDDYVAAFSAHAALFILISFFPFIMFLLTMVQYLPFTQSYILSVFTNFFPDVIDSFIVSIITEIYQKSSGTLMSITVITALWSASRGFLSIVRGLNSVYGIKETRNYFHLRFISTLYTLVFAVMIIICLCFLVFGNSLYVGITNKFPFLKELALLIISMRTMVALCVLVIFFLLLYKVIPNRKSSLFNELPGALLSAGGWMLFSYLYSYYIDNMGNFSYMYGSLTVIVLLILWLYSCMYIMFIGAEINVAFNTSSFFKNFKSKYLKGTKKK